MKNPRSKRSPERLLDAKEGSEDELSYLRNMFCSHLAYPKPDFLYTSKSKIIENRIWQNFDRNREKC